MSDIASLLEADRPVTWLFAGDSITQGAVHTSGWRGYTELFHERLGELDRNEDVVVNAGAGGWTVRALHSRVDERVLRFRPDVVFLMFGTNDAAAGEDGLDAFTERYADVIEQLRDAGIERLAMQTAFPIMPLDPDAFIGTNTYPDEMLREAKTRSFASRVQCIEAYVEATRRVAESLDVPIIDHWSVWKDLGTLMGHYTDGGFHPNEYGHRLIAHTIIRQLDMWDPASRTCKLYLP